MADQGRWFKLWASAPDDPGLLALSPALRWAWAALGVYTKVHGTHGVLEVDEHNPVLAAHMGVLPGAVIDTIRQLPNIHVEEGKKCNGWYAVTWKHWQKYQEDSTVTERVRRWRAGEVKRHKRRREEKRGEEKKPPPLSSSPDEAFLNSLRDNPAYRGIDLDRELAKMDVWFLTPRGRGRKKTRQFIVNWLNRVDRSLEGGGSKEDGEWQSGLNLG